MNGNNCFPPPTHLGPRSIPSFGHALEPAPPFGPAPVMPGGRLARIAARRRFVEMKQAFIQAASLAEGPRAGALRQQVRRADEPLELLALQCDLLHAMPEDDDEAATSRMELERHIDLLFPEPDAPTSPKHGAPGR